MENSSSWYMKYAIFRIVGYVLGYIEYEPLEKEEVCINFIYIGKFKRMHSSNKKRKLTGKNREKVQHELIDHCKSTTFYRKEFAYNNMSFNEMEPADLPHLSTLRYFYLNY